MKEVSCRTTESARDCEVKGKILIPERQAVILLNARGGDVNRCGSGRERGAGKHGVFEERYVGDAAILADAIERGPVDPVIFGRIDGLERVGVEKTEVECQAREVEIGQIFDRRMLEDIIGVVENGYGEVGRIAKGAADLEAGGGRVVNRCGGGEAVESAEIECSIWL